MFFIHFAPRLWSVKVNNICQLSYLRCMRHALILFLSGRLTRRLYTTAICKSVALYSISNTPCSWRDCSGVSKVTLYFCRSVTHFVFRGLQRNVGAHILLQVLFIVNYAKITLGILCYCLLEKFHQIFQLKYMWTAISLAL